jgi:hypothetical protein
MSQIVASCLVYHGSRCFKSDRVEVGAIPRYDIVGTGASGAPHLERAIKTVQGSMSSAPVLLRCGDHLA